MKKIGFACKLSELHPTKGVVSIPEFNNSTTTVAWLAKQHKDVSIQKLYNLAKENISAVANLVKYTSSLDPSLRMVRLGSDILPVFTHPEWKWFWKQTDVISYCETHFAKIGEIARTNNVRLSFHPSQFTVLASDNPEIVNKSIEEFEYHATMAAWMGYGKQFQDFKINVHISGRQGPDGIRKVLDRLSPEARNCITIENEEMSHGLDNCLMLADVVPIVLDVHHHHIHSGEYIKCTDPRISKIIDSWRGVRPVIHYSASREDLLVNHPTTRRPHLPSLLDEGYSKQKLRAHSDFMWNTALNKWAYTHWSWADVMVEAKGKNLASFKLFEFWKSLENTVSPVLESKTNTSSDS